MSSSEPVGLEHSNVTGSPIITDRAGWTGVGCDVSIPRSRNVERLLQPELRGSRITMRYQRHVALDSGEPTTTDLVGTLIGIADDTMRIRDRHGIDHFVHREDILAARVVPDHTLRLRHATDVDPATLERIAAAGWRPREQTRVGGWLLRASEGFTGRGNSVLPLADPDLAMDDALAVVDQWYADRGLPVLFAIPTPWANSLDDALAERGFELHNPTHVMVSDIAPLLEYTRSRSVTHHEDVTTSLTTQPDRDWLATYQYRGVPVTESAIPVLLGADDPSFVTVRVAGHVAAVGRGAVTPGWLGITAIDVVGPYRRQGFAHTVLGALAAHASSRGTRYAYLQVDATNVAARALYNRCGFVDHHMYHYRRRDHSL